MVARPYFDPVLTGENLRRIRKMHHKSVEAIREYMELESTQAVYKWEQGKCFPTVDNFVALARMYDMHVEELLVEVPRTSIVLCGDNYFSVIIRV